MSCSAAKMPDDVTPYIIPEGMYRGYSCGDLSKSASDIVASVPELKNLVEKKYKEQMAIQAAALIIAWPIGFALDNKLADQNKLAIAVGRMNTISSLYKKKGC
jgi:hypothetical protein